MGEDNEVRLIPDSLIMTIWRNIISAIYSHPTLLFHEELTPLRDLFYDFGAVHEGRTTDFIVPLAVSYK
jgi:hypothetical protein